MTPPVTAAIDPTLLERAADQSARAAEHWAGRVGVEIETVSDEGAAREAVGVLARVWPQGDGIPPIGAELTWALAHAGNYVGVARHSGTVVAASVGFRGADQRGPLLHSHILGVAAEHQGGRVGFALKLHQRAWALAAGLDRVTWTFDPLVARNAYFNVMKLGARLDRFYVDFYGRMADEVNAGDQSDRCLVTWDLAGDRAVAASAGDVPDAEVEAQAARAVAVLDIDDSGQPVLSSYGEQTRLRLAHLPRDIVALRRQDPDSARRWREALRRVLLEAFDASLEVTGVTRTGAYVIESTDTKP